MTPLKFIVATVALTAPLILASMPAEAITANQEALQGRGLYTTSKGVPEGYSRGYYGRGYYPPRYGYGYRYRRYHRGYY